MTNKTFKNFHPLPKRNYDIHRFCSYPDSLMGKEREEDSQWHCFTVFDKQISNLINQFLAEQHNDCECYCKRIYNDNLTKETITRLINAKREIYNDVE